MVKERSGCAECGEKGYASGSSREQSSCVFHSARARPECTKTLVEDDAQVGEGKHGDCCCWCSMALGVRLEKRSKGASPGRAQERQRKRNNKGMPNGLEGRQRRQRRDDKSAGDVVQRAK